MHRPPRKHKHPIDDWRATQPPPLVARFDPDDRALIEGVWSRVVTEQPTTDPHERWSGLWPGSR